MSHSKIWNYVAVTAVLLLTTVCVGFAEGDLFEESPWVGSVGLGHINFEGDEEVEDSQFLALKLGYYFNANWAVQYGIDYMQLDAREFPAEEERYKLDGDIWGLRLSVEALYHLRNTKDLHFDPYLSLGTGAFLWEESLGSGTFEPMLTVGGGMFYHFNDAWGVHADIRTMVASTETEGRLIAMAGVSYRWGASVPPSYTVEGGDIDSDGDGLLDDEEAVYGTDPYHADTDEDGLGDGDEVNVYQTDPLNADSDWDALMDGAEVLTYQTDPLNADTDGGGVADGHEVIEDLTDPLDPSDDLELYTLNIEFDVDKAIIDPMYYDQLDVVVRVLQRSPETTARIEGHADKRKTSDEKYNLQLSERRAKAVVDYLVDVGGIARERLSYEGFGFSRPVAPNDTEENMQKNRRTEIYIRSPETE